MLNPLLDAGTAETPVTNAFPQSAFAAGTAPHPNLLLGILRRWPWLILGLAAGLVLGLLYHMQRAPVYQSNGQLLVIKNRPEMTASGAADARVQFVEDYVATQVLYLRSERILEQAAKRLDNHKPFQVPPPATDGERVAFLTNRFAVAREKEPGTTTMSNILLVTFKAPHPADAPKYLRAIIEAYRADLGMVYSGASATQLESLKTEISAMRRNLNTVVLEREKWERELRGKAPKADEKSETGAKSVQGKVDIGSFGISQEELSSVRARISNNRVEEGRLRLRLIVITTDLVDIDRDGKTRPGRLALMSKYGLQSERGSILNPDPKDPDTMLEFLKYSRLEMANKFGEGHPEMRLNLSRIKLLEAEIAKRGGQAEDELSRYQRKLENERGAIEKQLETLNGYMITDEAKAARMSELQGKIDGLNRVQERDEALLRDKERERDRVTATESVGGYKVEEVSKPSDGVQIAPVLAQSLLLGAVLGLLLGSGLGLWAELADRSFRSPADIRRRLGVPVLGHVPPIRTTDPPEFTPTAALDPILATLYRPHSAESEAIRGIRTQLLFTTSGRVHTVLQITSPNPGDGKSTLAANLSVSLATSGKRVVLVDCDFRKPRVHRIFAIDHPEIGLASVVADQADLGGAVQSCEIENLSILPCGPRPANPAELLTTPKFQEVLDELRGNYDFVILDTPPVLAVSDPAAVAPRADGVILVFRMTKDARPAAERAKEDLTAVGGKLLGVVVNASTEREMGYGYGHGYRYNYQYSDSYADPKSDPQS